MQTIRKMAVFWLYLCLVNIVFAQNRAAYLSSSSNSATIEHNNKFNALTIPFEKSGNLLLVKAEIDHREGFFILDTGAPTLVVNQQATHSEIQAKGMSGKLAASDTFIKIFRWNNVEWKNVSSLSVDMRKFNDVSKDGLKGLIGYEILRNYELVVDPAAQTIQLISNRKELPYNPNEVLASVPMQQKEHMPVIEISINGKKILLGVDTGAEINFLDQRLFDNGILVGEKIGTSVVKGLGDQEKKEQKMRVRNLDIGGLQIAEQNFTLSDFSQLFPLSEAPSLNVQGIVGSAFLNQFRYSINYRKGVFTVIDKL